MYKNARQITDFVTDKIKKCRILVIGDVMLDKYYFGEVKRISPEAPVPITRVTKIKETLGGAANVAHNLALLGCDTYLIGTVGKDVHCDSLIEKLQVRGIHHDGLLATDAPTTTKVRIMGGHQQMMRLDFEEVNPVSDEVEKKLFAYLKEKLDEGIDSIIISDYGKGLCTSNVCQYTIQMTKKYNVPVVIDPKGSEWNKYRGADYITPNLKEINEVISSPILNEDEAVKKAAQWTRRKFSIKNIVLTRSEKGLSFLTSRKVIHIPTLAQEVFDVSGAGDTVISVFGAALGGKVCPEDAAYLANLAASVVVAKLGTYAVSNAELLEALKNRLEEE